MPLSTTFAGASARSLGLTASSRVPYDPKWILTRSGNAYYATGNAATAANIADMGIVGPFATGVSAINDLSANGRDLYVCVGNSGQLSTSPDAVNWTSRTSSFGSTHIKRVAYGKLGVSDYWVAVGDSGKVATSPDGITWTQRTTGASASTNVNTVSYGNGVWAIGCNDGTLFTATDPTSTWTSRTSTLAIVGDIIYVSGLTEPWIAGMDTLTTTGALASSTDGTTWTARNITNASDSSYLRLVGIPGSVAAIYAGSLNFWIPYSTNGTTWTDPGTNYGATSGTSATSWGGGADDGTTILATRANTGTSPFQSSLRRSTNGGQTWTSLGVIESNTTGWGLRVHSSGRMGTR